MDGRKKLRPSSQLVIIQKSTLVPGKPKETRVLIDFQR